jgi:predicted ester cyclase
MNQVHTPAHPFTFRYTPIDQALNIANKRRVMQIMQELISAPPGEAADALREAYTPDAAIHVTHPLNTLTRESAASAFWETLRCALPDAERRDDIVNGGHYNGAGWVACMGHYIGTFEHDWLDIPATHGVVTVRFAEAHAVQDGQITTSYVFIDFLDLMRQAGYWLLPPSLGAEMRWLPPATHDGVILTPQDDALSQRSIDRVLAMHAALGRYSKRPPTRAVLDEMGMVNHWHPHFMWYGPAGIGTTRGLAGFEDHHQIPFLVAFPDRAGSEEGHFIRIGDGDYAVTGGWGYLQATHNGGSFLGAPPTGKRIAMRVMDFYRCDANTIVENWVPIDIPHILMQMGVDLFGRLRHQTGRISAADWLVKAVDALRPPG